MIDVGKLKAELADYAEDEVVRANFTRRYFDQIVAEIVAGREAMEQLELLRERDGQCFGLKGDRL